MPKGYDPACAVLALLHLPQATATERDGLAQAIQDHVEHVLASREVLVVHSVIRPEERE